MAHIMQQLRWSMLENICSFNWQFWEIIVIRLTLSNIHFPNSDSNYNSRICLNCRELISYFYKILTGKFYCISILQNCNCFRFWKLKMLHSRDGCRRNFLLPLAFAIHMLFLFNNFSRIFSFSFMMYVVCLSLGDSPTGEMQLETLSHGSHRSHPFGLYMGLTSVQLGSWHWLYDVPLSVLWMLSVHGHMSRLSANALIVYCLVGVPYALLCILCYSLDCVSMLFWGK